MIEQGRISGYVITGITLLCGLAWAFPLYWGIISSLKPEDEVVRSYIQLWPETLTFKNYYDTITRTPIAQWYFNSVVVAASVTFITVGSSMLCGYAISQIKFPGSRWLYFFILASFMVPLQTLIINHFVLMAGFGFLNRWLGIILPQLIHPIVIIVYKQFFDGIPKDFREAAVMDNASEWRILSKIYLPMNWGITTAMAIVVFIWTWNAFLWPFLAASKSEAMTMPVGIVQVRETFGVFYAHDLAAAVLVGLPVAVLFLFFQRKVTQAITLSAGIKG